jgi:phosphatidylserine synthase
VSLSILLDHFDGIVARMLNQTSRFGVFLDVLIDNATRGTLYIMAASLSPQSPTVLFVASLLIFVEWTTFVCTHGGSILTQTHWKAVTANDKQTPLPTLIVRMFDDNFRNPLGVLTIAGLNALPLYLYARSPVITEYIASYPFVHAAMPLLGVVLALGRLCALFAELYFVRQHILILAKLPPS